MLAKKIGDMGVKYDGARKDQVTQASKNTVEHKNLPKLVRLASLWTVPNWAELAIKSEQDRVRSMVFFLLHLKLNKTAYFNKRNFNFMSESDAKSVIEIANSRYTNSIKAIADLFENHVFESTDIETAYGEINKALVKHFFCQEDVTTFSKKYGYSFRFQNFDRHLIKLLTAVGFGSHTKFDLDNLFSYSTGTYGRKPIYLVTYGLNGKAYKCPENGYITADQNDAGLEEVKRKALELNIARYQNNIIFKNKDFHKRALPCASDVRIGQDHLNGAELTPEKFMADLKFRGVEFGNWVTEKERNDFLIATYNALADLMDILGLPLHYASLNGRIGIAFGSRGTSNASAKYEPDQQLISITKTKAIGNLAHEYFHALDHFIAENEGIGLFASNNVNKVVTSQAPLWNELGKIVLKAISGDCFKTSKNYDSTRSKAYFSTKEEMMARTFEQWVEHTLESKGQCNPFLVFDTIPSPDEEVALYPLKDEMLEIAPFYQHLSKELSGYFNL